LLIGSEGTLAWTKRLHLKLAPLPGHKRLGVVNFSSFYRAMDSAQHLVKLGPVAVELVDRTMIDLARANPAFSAVMESALVDAKAPTPEAMLLVEFAGDEAEVLDQKLLALAQCMADLGLPDTVVLMRNEAHQKALWEVRKAGLNIMMSLKGDGKPVSFIEDCAVPLEHLAEYTDALSEVFRRHGSRGTWYAHASVGTLHVRPILDMRRDGAVKMRAIAEEASALVRKYKGAFSGEHGDGLVRSQWVSWQFGPHLTKAFEQVKDWFDPKGLMNPGKIVRAPKMDDTSLFRYAPGYAALPLKPVLDWSAWDVQNNPVTEAITAPGTGQDPAAGLAKAVEMCNNNGHCRKFDAGTMCPSYRITRDEQHLTRGRANTLRLALSGQLDEHGLVSPLVKQALDLCVSCKGCKRDCPTGVDMARMKVEFKAHWHQKHGWSLRDKLVAHLPAYAPYAQHVGWLLNLRNRIKPLARTMETLTGFSAERNLPAWPGQSFWQKHKTLQTPQQPPKAVQGGGAATRVLLWVDTFNGHFEPELLDQTMAVLASMGFLVEIAKPGHDQCEKQALCCGRTYLASGMLDEAKRHAARTVNALLPAVDQGAWIVGLEPSCVLSLRDEFLAMGLGQGAQTIAQRTRLLEEFLLEQAATPGVARWFERLQGAKPLSVAVHGHCHQKAFGAFGPVVDILKKIPGATVQTLESSCCGMAGSFGYEKEHQQASAAMANLSLIPAVKELPDDTWVVADGTSCRHQIEHFSGSRARHVIEVLYAVMPDAAAG
jgi:Fe-S oxidoreductase